jgi:hypothetical protein
MNVKYTYSHYMEYATNKNMTGNNSICRHALSTLILHRDDNLTMRHQKGTDYSASKLIRKGKPFITNFNLQLMNMPEHLNLPTKIGYSVLSPQKLIASKPNRAWNPKLSTIKPPTCKGRRKT